MLHIKFYEKDPLLTFLIDWLKLTWWKAMLFWLVIWSVDSVLYTYINHLVLSNSKVIGLLEDIIGQLSIILWTDGVILGFYVWNGKAFSNLFWNLYKSRAFIDESDYISFITKIEQLWNKKIWVILPLIAAIMWFFAVFLPFAHLPMVRQPRILCGLFRGHIQFIILLNFFS